MANNSKIVITAGLQKRETVSTIQNDLKSVSEQLNANRALQITCNIDLKKTTQRIQSQLNTISSNLKLNIGNIDFDTRSTTANVMSNIQNASQKTAKEVDKVSNSLRDLNDTFTRSFNVLTTNGYTDANKNITLLEKKLAPLGEVSVKGLYSGKEASDSEKGSGKALDGLIATIKNARGELRTLRFEINETGNAFEYVSGTYNDSGVLKQSEQLTRFVDQYISKLNTLKAKVGEGFAPNIKATLNEDIISFDTFEKKLAELKNGKGNVEELRAEFVALDGAVKNLGSLLRGGDSSLNQFTNAINNARNFSNELKNLQVAYEGLNGLNQSETTFNSLAEAQQKLIDLQRTQSQDGYNEKWIRQYQELSILISQITSDIKLAKNLESQDASSSTKKQLEALREINAAYQKIQQYSKVTLSPSATNEEKGVAESYVTRYRQVVASTIERLQNEGLLTKEVSQQIQEYDNLLIDAQNLAKAKLDGIALQQKEVELQRQSAQALKESERTAKNASAKITLDNRIAKVSASLEDWSNKNKKVAQSTKLTSDGITTFAEKLKQLQSRLRSGNLSADDFKHLNEEIATFKKEADAANLTTNSFFRSMRIQLSQVLMQWISLQGAIRIVKSLVNEVITLDNAMVELRKVTEASDKEFEDFQKSAAITAKTLGASVSDVINATSTFSRAGFNLPDAEELGRVATLYKNVGDGIDIDGASESIISVMRAFNMEASEAERIIDRINNVSNNFAIDSQGLGFALQRVASAMSAANNTLDETIALTTVANEIVQNPEMVAQGWRTVALRIRGAKTELEEAGEDTEGMVESTAKLRELIKGISGVDIMIDENTFKSTYQIIEELGKVWNDISDIDQASLLEAIAGKRQSNIVAAALNNYERLDEVLDKSVNSTGSAMREQDKYAKSIQYSLDTLKAAYQEFAQTIVNSDFAKNLLGGAQKFLEILTKIIDTFGTLPVIMGGLGAFGGKKLGIFGTAIDDVDKVTKKVTLFGKELSAVKADLRNSDTKGLAKVGVALDSVKVKAFAAELAATALNAALSFGLSLAVSLLIKGVGSLVDKLIVTEEELNEVRQSSIDTSNALRDNTKSFIEEAESIKELVTQYKQVALSIDTTVNAKDKLSQIQADLIDKFGKEANGLDLVNGKYDEQIQKIDELSKAQYEQWKTENADKIKDAEKVINYNVGWVRKDDNGRLTEEIEGANQVYLKGWVDHTDDLAASLYKIEDVSEDIQDIYQNIAGIDFVDGFFSNDIFLSGTVEDAKNQLEQLIQAYSQLENVDKETLAKLTKQYNYLNTELENAEYYMSEIRKYEAPEIEVIGEVSKENLNKLDTLYTSVEETRAKWFESMNEIENGFGKTVDTMTSALQTLANGEGLSNADFWKIMELDTDKIITDIKMVNGQYVLNQEQLMELKDQYINQQIASLETENQTLKTKKEQLQVTLDEAQAEVALLGARGLSNSAYRAEYQAALETIRKGKENLQEYGEQIKRNNIYITQWEQKLGNTVNLTEALAAQQKRLNDEINQLNKDIDSINKEIDNRLKAQEYVIDNVISKHEEELSALESEKQSLQDELDSLNEQKSALEDIIKQYDTVNSVVQSTIEKQKKALEDERKSIEDTYNKRIEALKTENEEREDALEYAQKLANLENARNNKRYVYDETRGYRYESVKEDVQNAQSDLDSFENARAIKELEKERDNELAKIDNQIKLEEEYAEIWKVVSEEIQTAEDELLAEQILGADWREQIANHDVDIMKKFKAEYKNHNAALKTLTNTEIKLKEEAIKAKDAEIKSKQEQINSWKNYKKQVEDAVSALKTKNGEYVQYLDTVKVDENSTLEQRTSNFETFKNKISGLVDDIGRKQSVIDSLSSALDNLSGGDYDINFFVSGLDNLREARDILDDMAIKSMEVITSQEMVERVLGGEMSLTDAVKAMREGKIRGYSSGGVVDETGIAMLHGRKNAPELILNARDSAKLYSLIHNTPNLIANTMLEANKLAGFKLNNNNNNSGVSIGAINVYANNPRELTRNLDKEFDQYFRNKLTESYTGKQ